jgi:hypothetical protein
LASGAFGFDADVVRAPRDVVYQRLSVRCG